MAYSQSRWHRRVQKAKGTVRVYSLEDRIDSPYMVMLFGPSKRLVCACGPYGAHEKNDCIKLLARGDIHFDPKMVRSNTQHVRRLLSPLD